MRVRHDHLLMRVLGIAAGVAFLALGLIVVIGGEPWPDAGARGRGLGLGLTLVVGGIAAIVASATVIDPGRVW